MTELRSTEDEWRLAAERLEGARGNPQASPSYDARIRAALDLVREGDLETGRSRLAELAAQGSAPATGVLVWLDRYGSDAVGQEDDLRGALAQIRNGDVQHGYAEVLRLADDGYGPACHFLAWLHRYRAEQSLRAAAARFQDATAAGHGPSQRHLDRTLEALQIVGYPSTRETEG